MDLEKEHNRDTFQLVMFSSTKNWIKLETKYTFNPNNMKILEILR